MISLLLVLIPWNLQRRFLTGLFLPLAGLSVYGLNTITNSVNLNRTGRIILFCLVIPTNLVVVFSGINAASIRDPQIFIKSSVISATTWIENNTESSALFLSNEKEGLLIKHIDTSSFPVKCEYELTNIGHDFINIIKDIKHWALRWRINNKVCEQSDCKNCEL